MMYPPCPKCGHELQIGDFYREVDARRVPSFGEPSSYSSLRFHKDRYTGKVVPNQFSITCARCGATSAIDTSPPRVVMVLMLVMVIGFFVVWGLLMLTPRVTGFAVVLCLGAYLGICGAIARVVDRLGIRVFTVKLVSVPGPEREHESRAERRARADHDAGVEIASLGPEFERVVEPVPLEPELADVAARIDAAHAEAAPAASGRPEYERAEEEALERSKVVCEKCGRMNQREFEKCWNCEAALPGPG